MKGAVKMRLIDAELYDEFLTQYAQDLFEIDAPMIAGAIERCQSKLKAQPTVDAIVPPCKIGSTIYMIVTKRHRKDLPEFSFIKTTYMTESNFFRVCRDYGKTVFLTREEAEAALDRMKG